MTSRDSTLLSINNYYYRRDGSEVVYFDHNEIMKQHGWEVVPFSMHHNNNRKSDWSDYFIDEIEFGNDYTFIEKIRRVPKVIYSFEARQKLEKLISITNPTIAHCHTIYHHISPSILSILKSHRIPSVMTLHDLKLACPAYHMYNEGKICEDCNINGLHSVVKNRCIKGSTTLSSIVYFESLLHKALKSYQKNIDVFISPCQFYIDKLVSFGWSRDLFQHIPNPVDCDNYQPTFEEPEDYILYFGRLSPEKGLTTLLEAAKIAKVKIVIAGDGPQKLQLRILADKLGVDIQFTGHLSGGNLEKVIRKAKFSVLPAQWYENAPMSILESYALGTPAIGTNIGGIPELIIDTETGYLCDSNSVESLARTLKKASMVTMSKRSTMAKTARKFVEDNFSMDIYQERIFNLYNQLKSGH